MIIDKHFHDGTRSSKIRLRSSFKMQTQTFYIEYKYFAETIGEFHWLDHNSIDLNILCVMLLSSFQKIDLPMRHRHQMTALEYDDAFVRKCEKLPWHRIRLMTTGFDLKKASKRPRVITRNNPEIIYRTENAWNRSGDRFLPSSTSLLDTKLCLRKAFVLSPRRS